MPSMPLPPRDPRRPVEAKEQIVLEPLFAPKSILIVGIPPSPRNLARKLLANLRSSISAARFPPRPRDGTMCGHRIRTSFDELPDGIDLAVILTPARTRCPES